MQIKSGQRLQPVAGSKRAAKSKGDGKATEVASEPAVVDPVVAEAGVLKKPRKGKATKDKTVDTSEKRLSCVSAALKVLAESEQPLNTKEMIEAMLAKGYWSSPGGKTPHDAVQRDSSRLGRWGRRQICKNRARSFRGSHLG
ncbi:MAG: HTH domain-containing protein [Pirellulaceae bacterium]